MRLLTLTISLLATITAYVTVSPAAAQTTTPAANVCVQQGGSLPCKEVFFDPPIKGGDDYWQFSYTSCRDSVHQTFVDKNEFRTLNYILTGPLGGKCSVTSNPSWPVPSNPQTTGLCGSSDSQYPHNIFSYEIENFKNIGLSCEGANAGDPPNPSSVTLYRTRIPHCPDGYAAVDSTLPYCKPIVSTICFLCESVGDPVSATTRTMWNNTVDFTVNGSPLQFSRFYNSKLDHSEFMGAKWQHNYEKRIDTRFITLSAGVVFATREDARIIPFWKTGNGWATEGVVNDQLTSITDVNGNIAGWTLKLAADETVEQYDASGRLISQRLRNGQSVFLAYSATTGRLATVTDDFGRTIQLTYKLLDAEQNLWGVDWVIAPDGSVYQYDIIPKLNNGKNILLLQSVTQPSGAIKQYLYNEPGNVTDASYPTNLTAIIDENGSRFLNVGYSYYGDVTFNEHAGGTDRYTFGNFDSGSGGAIVGTPLGSTYSLDYANVGGIVRAVQRSEYCATCANDAGTGSHANGSLIRYGFGYDTRGNMTSQGSPELNFTDYVYDSRNLEISRTEGTQQTTAYVTPVVLRTTTTTWHPTFRLPATITEPVTGGSRVTTNTYDANGNLTNMVVATPQGSRSWSWTYDTYGRVLTSTDSRGNVTTATYYANDAAQGNKRGMLATVTNAAGHTTTITDYNLMGRPLSLTDANGLTVTFTYDIQQRLIARTVANETTLYEYDLVDQLTKVTLPDGSYQTFTYDAAHRLVQIKDSIGNRIVYTLDAVGNRVKEDVADQNNALARTKSRGYDILNRLSQEVGGSPGAPTTQYRYDVGGKLRVIVDPLGRTLYYPDDAYDSLNRLRKVSDLNGSLTLYDYDLQDNLTQVTDPKGLVTSYSYNGFNELVSQVSPDTGTTSFTYDAGGNLATKTDARNITATYSYDSLNRVTSITYPDETVTYVYDTCANGKGRLCSLTDKTGGTSYSYDIKGRLTGKSQTVSGLTQTVAYGYNTAGQLTSMTLPSGKVVAYTYTNNRITGLSYDGQPVIKNADYEPFGPVGEWVWGNDTPGTPNKHTRYFDLGGRTTKIESGNTIDPALIVYDAASRITALQKLTSNAVDPAKSISYDYDLLDRLTTVTPGAGNPALAQGYTYDAIGNRLTNTVAGSVTNYSYGASSHRLNALTGATAKSYTYDAVGNRIGDGVQTWTYGGNNRPTSVSINGNPLNTVQSGINALGQRVLKTVNGTATRFVYDESGHLIGEYQLDGTLIREHLWLNDMPVGVVK